MISSVICRDFDLISIIYDKFELKRDAIAKLAILVYRAAQQFDPKALTLYEQAAYEHSLTVKSIIYQLHFSAEEDILVSYSGGVFKAGEFILDPLKKYLQEVWVRLIKPVLAPVSGAALYAIILDGINAGEQQVSELKKQEATVIAQ